jgi:tetratricopeptide (TPR) repeat protein
LYDLIDDPEEQHNLIERLPGEADRLWAALEPKMRDLEGQLRIDPTDAERLRALGYVDAVAAPAAGPLPDPKDRISSVRLLNQATGLAAAGRFDEAIDRLRELLATNPGLTAGWLQLARISQESGRLQEAISAYEMTIDLNPALTARCGAALTSIYMGLRRYDEAEAWARRCVDAGATYGHLQLGRIHLLRGELADAEAEARTAMEDPIYRVVGAVLLAEVLAGRGRIDEALETIDAAVAELGAQDLDPVPRLHFVRGDILGRKERLGEAEQEFLAEISWFPDNLVAYTNLAVVYYVTGRTDQARAALERMVGANPSPVSLLMAERTCRQVGDTEAAAVWQRRIESRRQSSAPSPPGG